MVTLAFSISDADRAFLAGFLEGETCLTIAELNGGQSYSCGIRTALRDDDQEVLEWLAALTGLGTLRRIAAQRTSRPQIAWSINSQDDCLELLKLLDSCGFHGRRAAELGIWRQAVEAWTTHHGAARRATMRSLKDRLEAARRFGAGAPRTLPFGPREHFLGYISGFVCAEGCFAFSNGRPRFSVHLRQDDRPLLELLSTVTGLGKVSSHSPVAPNNPSSTWTVAAQAEMANLADLLREGGLAGRKRSQMEAWAVAVDEVCSARRLSVRPRRELIDLAAERVKGLRVYRPPEREDLLELSRRDLRSESLAALTAWSVEFDGRLGCMAYETWRRRNPGSPTRNTIVRHLGSWYEALAAAGLEERAAASPAVVAARHRGGDERRERRVQEQRARVIAAVRRFEAAHGRLPRALEFFRWRLQAAPHTPSQGMIYRLFPGGWTEVMLAIGPRGDETAAPCP
jgi:hypothetical protein